MKTSHFSTSEELREAVAHDANLVTRYPTRFILIDGLQAWRDTLIILSDFCQRSVRLSSLTPGDALPNLQSVIDAVGRLTDSIVLRPVGEVMRLVPGMIDAYMAWLTSISAPGKARLYVPLLSVSASVIPSLESMRQYLEYSPPIWCYESLDMISVKVVSEQYPCLGGKHLAGLKVYLLEWEDGGCDASLLTTQYAEVFSSSHGTVSFEVLPTAFDVVLACCTDSGNLRQEWGNKTQWEWLAKQFSQTESIHSVAARILKVPSFDSERLWELWSRFDQYKQWLAWLWLKNSLTGDHPAAVAVTQSQSFEQLPEIAANLVFSQVIPTISWLANRRQLLSNISVGHLPDSFWSKFEAIKDPMVRLVSLPGLSSRDLEAIVETVGVLVSAQIAQDRWLPVLQEIYPDLYTYLTMSQLDEWLEGYFRAYKLSRVADSALPDLLVMACEWAHHRMLWDFDTRASIFHHHHVDVDSVLWVDGLGLEWVGLLWHKLINQGLRVDVDIARTNLPSVTANNHDWTSAQVIRGMDGYAHSHEYSYPQALIRQMSVIYQVVDEVTRKLQSSQQVVIASDHGMTRFAPAGDRVDVPDGYRAHGWGRHAYKIDHIDIQEHGDEPWINEGDFLILAKHGLFRGGNATSGEVHGGATPEESLVPILRVSIGAHEIPTISIYDLQVKLSVHGEGSLHVELLGVCSSLKLYVAAFAITGRRHQNTSWTFELTGLVPGGHNAQLVCEWGPVGNIAFECSRGMAETDLGL